MRASSPKTPSRDRIRAFLEQEHAYSVDRQLARGGGSRRRVFLEAVAHEDQRPHRHRGGFPARMFHDTHDLRATGEATYPEHRCEEGVRRRVPARVVEVGETPEVDQLDGQIAVVACRAKEFRVQGTGEIPGGRAARRGVHGEDQTLRTRRYRWMGRARIGKETVDRTAGLSYRGNFFRSFCHQGGTAGRNGPIMPMTYWPWEQPIWKKPTQ